MNIGFNKITPTSVNSENITKLVPENLKNNEYSNIRDKKGHHGARSSIIFKKPSNKDLDFPTETSELVAQRTFQNMNKENLETHEVKPRYIQFFKF